MLPGYNHNVKYQDRVYHVQTEDSGNNNPHVITHLFFGGNILFSKKSTYADLLEKPDLTEQLKALMQEQHKSMLRGLIHGEYDTQIAERSANAGKLDGPAPLNVAPGAQQRTSLGSLAGGADPAPAAESSKQPISNPTPSTPPAKPTQDIAASADGNGNGHGHADGDGETAEQTQDLLATALGGKPKPKPSKGEQGDTVIEADALLRAFESPNEDEALSSIFGEALISKRSLDEVILSYLAVDDDEGP